MSLPTTTLQYSYQSSSYKNLVIKETPVPEVKPSEVLVKVHAVSLQFRDLMISKGVYRMPRGENLVPCSDMAGEIIAVGENVKDWKVSDRVCANFSPDHIHGPTNPSIMASSLGGGAVDGVLTQYRTFPAHSLVAVPEHLSYEEASTLPCAALTAYNALNGPVPIKAGDFVLVLGTGGVSTFALQFAVAAGATVIATSSSDDKLKIASKLGAKHLINYRTTPDWDEQVNKITKGAGVDHVIEVGGGTLLKSINSVRTGCGQIHIIGRLSTEAGDPSVIYPLIGKAATLRGIVIGSVAQFQDMNRLLIANPDVTKPVVDKIFSFDRAIDAFEYLESQKHVGKVVIKVA